MDWHAIVGIVSFVSGLASGIIYIYDILYGTSRPNAVSYFGWSLLLVIAFTAQISHGFVWSSVVLLASAINTTIIFLLSLKYGVTIYTKLDMLCLIFGVVAIIAWQLTDMPILAVLFAYLGDIIVGIPTILKAYKDPSSELPSAYLLSGASAFAGLLTLQSFAVINFIYPLYLMFYDSLVAGLSLKGRATQAKQGT